MKSRVVYQPGSELTLAWLYERVQNYVTTTKAQAASNIERWAFWIGIASAGVGLIVGTTWADWLPAPGALWAMKVLLAAEIAGLLIAGVLVLRRELPQLLRSRELHAAAMDDDFGKWRKLVEELRGFPESQRGARLRFIRGLREKMDSRTALVFGGTQRLGVFPLLIALYLQFRNWVWGDWAAAFDVNLVAGLLIWAMLLLYGAGWLLIGLRTRLETYESLLQESLVESEASD